MYQVLFRIPIHLGFFNYDMPIYGFGMMLFVAFVCCTWVVARLAKREGFDKDRIYDMAFWIFLCGIIGARIVFMIQYNVPAKDFYKIWQGGIVFYGSAIGGWIGYALYRLWTRGKYQLSTWKLADVVAPTVCVGLAIGRIGCLLNGCCYGHICTDCKWPQFPTMTAPSRELVVEKGFQTAAGFAIDPVSPGSPVVAAVEPHYPAEAAGLKVGDVIAAVKIVDKMDPVNSVGALRSMFSPDFWPRGQSDVTLTVQRGNTSVTLPAFIPRTLPLHPTQLYETISMGLLFFLLLAFFPYRRFYGEVFVLLMLGYAVHRFLNESLRNDTDPVFKNLTLSQVGSILVFLAGVSVWLNLWRSTKRLAPATKPAPA